MKKLSFTWLEKEGNIWHLIGSRNSIMNTKGVELILFSINLEWGDIRLPIEECEYGCASIQADHKSLHLLMYKYSKPVLI